MVKQSSIGPFIRNLLYKPDAAKHLKYPMHTSYEIWHQYNTHRKSTGGKGITNQNWNRIMYVLRELSLVSKIDKPRRSITPVPGEKHPSKYIPNTYLFTWEHITQNLGEITETEKQNLFDYLSSKHDIDWIYESTTEVSEDKDKISFIQDEDIIELIPNEEFDKVNIFLNDTRIDSLETRKEGGVHIIHFIDTQMDWKRTYYKAVPANIDSESWNNPQMAYRIKLNSKSFQEELATKELKRQWNKLIKQYTNTDTTAEINIDTPIPENWSPELKQIINKQRKLYIKKIIIPPRKDYVTIKVTKLLKEKIDAERGEMTISDYIESRLQ